LKTLSLRLAAPAAALVLAGLTATACAPSTSSNSESSKDSKSGTIRVWLFREVNNAPKEKVVKEAVAEFTWFWRGCPGVHAGEESPPVLAMRGVAASSFRARSARTATGQTEKRTFVP
jgi:hypothetical protein